jgi:hypothetical protein
MYVLYKTYTFLPSSIHGSPNTGSVFMKVIFPCSLGSESNTTGIHFACKTAPQVIQSHGDATSVAINLSELAMKFRCRYSLPKMSGHCTIYTRAQFSSPVGILN